jgi:hypothetical protein
VSEAIEGALGEDGIVEQGDPLVDGPVAGDDGGGAPVPFEDHLVEITRLLGGQASQAEVIEDEQIGSEQAAQHLLGGVIGTGLVKRLEEVIGAQEAYVVAGAAGSVAERTGEKGLSDSDRAEEDHILAAFDEAEAEELLHAVSVEGDGGIPVEVLQRLVLLEAGSGQAHL